VFLVNMFCYHRVQYAMNNQFRLSPIPSFTNSVFHQFQSELLQQNGQNRFFFHQCKFFPKATFLVVFECDKTIKHSRLLDNIQIKRKHETRGSSSTNKVERGKLATEKNKHDQKVMTTTTVYQNQLDRKRNPVGQWLHLHNKQKYSNRKINSSKLQ